MPKSNKEGKGKKHGPKPNHLKINEENWEDAVKKAIVSKNPKKAGPKRRNRFFMSSKKPQN